MNAVLAHMTGEELFLLATERGQGTLDRIDAELDQGRLFAAACGGGESR